VGFGYGIPTDMKNWTGVMHCRNLKEMRRSWIRKENVFLSVPNAHSDVFRCSADRA
jgi:hypothetical protein